MGRFPARTLALAMNSLMRGFEDCSSESSSRVNGEAPCRRDKSRCRSRSECVLWCAVRCSGMTGDEDSNERILYS